MHVGYANLADQNLHGTHSAILFYHQSAGCTVTMAMFDVCMMLQFISITGCVIPFSASQFDAGTQMNTLSWHPSLTASALLCNTRLRIALWKNFLSAAWSSWTSLRAFLYYRLTWLVRLCEGCAANVHIKLFNKLCYGKKLSLSSSIHLFCICKVTTDVRQWCHYLASAKAHRFMHTRKCLRPVKMAITLSVF